MATGWRTRPPPSLVPSLRRSEAIRNLSTVAAWIASSHQRNDGGAGEPAPRPPLRLIRQRGLISAYFAIAFSNFRLNSHIAARISRKLADVRARSAWPNAKMLLLRRCFMTVGLDTR